MNRQLACIILLTIALVPSLLIGQNAYVQESVFSDYLNQRQIGSFLYIPGLHFSSSVGYSYLSSKSFGSAGFGYYMGHFDWRISSSLMLRWDIALRSMVTGADANDSPHLYIPNIDLTYRPSDAFMLKFQFHQHGYPMSLRRVR